MFSNIKAHDNKEGCKFHTFSTGGAHDLDHEVEEYV
jgi:hypothetical protein